MDEILVDVDAFLKSKKTMEESLTVFSSYSKDYLKDLQNQLKPFNSDFVSKIMKTIDNLEDTTAPLLVKSLQGYADQLNIIAEGFTDLDESISNKLE